MIEWGDINTVLYVTVMLCYVCSVDRRVFFFSGWTKHELTFFCFSVLIGSEGVDNRHAPERLEICYSVIQLGEISV